MFRKTVIVLVLFAVLLSACGGAAPAAQEDPTLKIAVLPILDALPMYVADAQGYFKDAGIKVEFVPVASAAERDQVMQAGQADGMINDLISTVLYNKDAQKIAIVRFARIASPDRCAVFDPGGEGQRHHQARRFEGRRDRHLAGHGDRLYDRSVVAARRIDQATTSRRRMCPRFPIACSCCPKAR